MSSFLLFPTQLFRNIELLKNKTVYIIEDPRFFTDFGYHKLKLVLHRATMKFYFDYLKKNHIDVHYVNFNESIKTKIKGTDVTMYEPVDNKLSKKIKKEFPKINILRTLTFLFDKKEITQHLSLFSTKKKNNSISYNHQNFYKWQRKRLNILVDKDGNPKGGKWSFDEENRDVLPKTVSIPSRKYYGKNEYVKEAIEYVKKYFSKNYGSLDHFVYPVTFEECDNWLIEFLKVRFSLFGKYQDAETMRDPFLFHSVLSPMLNIGFLTDHELLDKVKAYEAKVPIASYEGFIRQVIGWRNYCYMIYMQEGEKMRKMNFFNHSKRINQKKMWTAQTNIQPIDDIINKMVNYGYAHHIERLMYLGNFMLICMIHPNDVYKLFMEWTVDAYDWVMVPNVYGMSQFADGGMMMTRCYFSSSNYILKMSDYKKGPWTKTFDALYYHFIYKHEAYLASNYATSRQVAFWKKKTESEKKETIEIATKYLMTI
jgi:deoxyribodipyrimidine photolyase-related protein